MTTFQDGPAKGVALALRRAPRFLRVTQCKKEFDALDQPQDTPRVDEFLYAYRLAKHLGNVHINRGSKGSGFYPLAEYAMVQPQPEATTMRSNLEWERWCEQQGGL